MSSTTKWVHVEHFHYIFHFHISFSFSFWNKGVRWLFSKERNEEATKILWQACKLNGTVMSQQTLNSLHERIEIREEDSKAIKSIDNEAVGKGKWREQISMRVIMQIANLSYCWFAIVFVYYGLNLNSVYLEYWNKYMNFIVSIFFINPFNHISICFFSLSLPLLQFPQHYVVCERHRITRIFYNTLLYGATWTETYIISRIDGKWHFLYSCWICAWR